MAGLVRMMSAEAEKAQELQKVVKEFADVMAKLVSLIQHSGPELQGKSVADIVSVKPSDVKHHVDEKNTDGGLHQ